MEEFNFTEDEVLQELAKFGYYNVPPEMITAFKRELEDIIKEDQSQSISLSTTVSDSSFNQIAGKNSKMSETNTKLKPVTYQSDIDYFHNNMQRDVEHLSSNNYQFTSVPVLVQSDTINPEIPQRQEHNYIQSNPKTQSSERAVDGFILKSCLKKSASNYDEEGGRHFEQNGFHLKSAEPRNDADDALSMNNDNCSQNGSTSSERRLIKRKVLRKQNGHVKIHSESIAESDSDLSFLGERMNNLHVNVLNSRPMSAPPKAPSSESSGHYSHVACREPLLYNLPDGYYGPKALIRPMSCEPHMKNIKKSDPVARYQKYCQSWNACKAPGERSHNQLRWDIRGQMLHQDQVVIKRPQPVHQPNTYVIPGDKKRKTLRWQIRNDLAQGIKPPSIFD